MESAGRHLAALCRETVKVALRTHEQRRQLDVHEKRIDLLEAAVGDLASSRGPVPLQVRRSESAPAESLTRSFEARLAARPAEEERPTGEG
jgi:hypothetical protein